MLKIEISLEEVWDEHTESFILPVHQTLQLEHSLIAIHKWEAKYHKSYLATESKTLEENLYYIECMIITKNFDPKLLYLISDDNVEAIANYIKDPMTATVVHSPKKKSIKPRVFTAELIYYYMTVFNIPVEFQKWHINQLITLIEVCNAEQDTSGEKISKEEAASRNAALNAENRRKYNSKG